VDGVEEEEEEEKVREEFETRKVRRMTDELSLCNYIISKQQPKSN
jgi:hypothetical protein